MKRGLWFAFSLLLAIPWQNAKGESSTCQDGMIGFDHQCIAAGNRIVLTWSSVFSVTRGQSTASEGSIGESTETTVEISGRGYTDHFGGSPGAPIPMTLTFSLKEDEKNEPTLKQLGTCHQAALLSTSGKEKYFFSVEMKSPTTLHGKTFSGNDGKFRIHLDPKSMRSQSIAWQCGNSLKGQ